MRGAASLRLSAPAPRSVAQALPPAAAVLVATADVLVLLGLPWYLMQTFKSLDALTLKAAYAGAAMAAAVLGEGLAQWVRERAGRPWQERLQPRRVLLALALFLATFSGILALLQGNWFINVPVVTLGAGVIFLLAGIALPAPWRTFPFGPRGGGVTGLAELDRFVVGAVLAALVLTVVGPAGEFLVAAGLYAAVAVVAGGVPAAATVARPRPEPAPELPYPVAQGFAWLARFLGGAGLRQAPQVSAAVALAFQVLFGLTVYKIKVHMEFGALALGLLMACGGVGEYLASWATRYVTRPWQAEVATYAGAVFTVGMFAGIAGNAFPPLVFVFWAGAAAAARWNDHCRRLMAVPKADPGAVQRLRLMSALAIFTAGYLVWWISTWLVRPHSINLVVSLAGVWVAMRIAWALVPSAVGQAGPPSARGT